MELVAALTGLSAAFQKSFEKWKGDHELQRNMLIIDCKCNLALLDILEWKGALEVEAFKLEVCEALSTSSLENVMTFGDRHALSFLFEIFSDNTSAENESRIVSLISAIKTLKQIISLKRKFPDVGNPDIDKRISNIKKKHLEILSYLNGKIANK